MVSVMAEGDEAASTSSNHEGSSLCEECNSNQSKYKCPGCSFRSCSLTCVNAHKQRLGCTGKRNQTQFVPLSQFNDSILLSDYNMLEEVKRISESAHRLRMKLCPYTRFRLPFHLKSLSIAASSRRTKILFLPNGMLKREKNQTRYNQRERTIFWTIEWRFNSTDVVLVDHGINENDSLSTILENHLQTGPWKNPLQKFREEQLDRLKLFVRIHPKGITSPFRELNPELPIRQLFSKLAVLEYPVIYVFLPNHSLNFEVVKDTNPVRQNPDLKNAIDNNHVSPKGIAFKEEEIEDYDSSFNPQVLDLMKQLTSSPPCEVDHGNMNNAAHNTAGLMGKLEDGDGDSSHLSSETKEISILKDFEFDFEQELIDSYSNIMAQINPDDFLDWENEFSNGMEVEELEEGEIIE